MIMQFWIKYLRLFMLLDINQMVIKCKRCNASFDTYSRLLRHLQRKIQCEPQVADIPVKDYIKEIDKLYQQVSTSVMSKKQEKKTRNFGEENMEALPDSLIHDLFLNLQVKELVENLHLDPNFYENKNVRFKDRLSSFEIYEKNEWHRNTTTHGINKIIVQAASIFEEYYKKNTDKIREDMTLEEEEEILEELEKLKCLDKSVIEILSKDIIELIKNPPQSNEDSQKYIQSKPKKALQNKHQ